MKNIKNLLLSGVIALALIGCGSSGGGVSKTEKKISGVALKADGSTFAEGSTVLAVDANGNTAEGTVDANGKFEVTLFADASSGKKSKDVEGNSFLRVTDGDDEMDLVIAQDQTNVNFNVVTSAASAVLLGASGLDLDSVFDAAETANGKKGRGSISSAALLLALGKVQTLTTILFKEAAQTMTNTLFGVDSNGNPAVNAENFLNGTVASKETTLLVAAYEFNNNLLASVVSAANSGDGLNLLNEDEFYAEIGKALAAATGVASNNAFSSFIDSVLKSDELKDALDALETELNAFVAAAEADPDASFTVVIPTLVESAENITLNVGRNGDEVTYSSITGGAANDYTDVTVYVVSSSSELEATITVRLTFDGTKLSAGKAQILVATDSVSVSVNDTEALDNSGVIELDTAIEEARAALLSSQPTLAGKLPTTLEGYVFYVTASSVRSGSDDVATFISTTIGGVTTTASSFSGIVLE